MTAGRYTGGTCPLGYTIDENKRYVIDPKHAPTVRKIFQLYAEGKTVTEIIANLLRAIEAGIFNESTKDRMNELEAQKQELRVALAAAKLKEELGLKKEHIQFFLHQFADMDYTDISCQKRLIKSS